MNRKSWLTAISCTALMAAVVAAGCGDASTVPEDGTGGAAAGTGGNTVRGTGGNTVRGTGGVTGTGGGIVRGTGGGIVTGTGGGIVRGTGGTPADGGMAVCRTGAACTGTETCNATCMAGGQTGTRACMCSAMGTYTCGNCTVPAMDGGQPPPDGGMAVCRAGAACTGTETCSATCMAGGQAGTRACTCGMNGTYTCGNCTVPAMDGGMAVCRAGAACTGTETCSATCMAGGQAGTRACTCGMNGTYTCGNCTVAAADGGTGG
jgi:hypothetical protein